MRIFCAVRHANNSEHYYGTLWSGNFYPALRQLGHQIIESQTDLYPTSRFMDIPNDFTVEEREARARTTQQILDEVRIANRSGPVHLFLSYFYNSHFDPAGFDELHSLGIPTVNFFCNSIHQFELVAQVAEKADFSWHAEKHARDSYLKVGARPVWVQMAADPIVYRPVPGIARQPKACFVGQRYADRDRWLAALVRADMPIDIFRSGWQPAGKVTSEHADNKRETYLGRRKIQAGSCVSYFRVMRDAVLKSGVLGGLRRVAYQWNYSRETIQLTAFLSSNAKGRSVDIVTTFAAYDLCLNFSNVWADGRPGSTLIPHVRLRDFEAPMCRTCYLTGHTDEIEEFYEVGREIVTYRTPAELVDKVRFYLKNPHAAEQLRQAGYLRATINHTWVHRFQELFRKIGMQS